MLPKEIKTDREKKTERQIWIVINARIVVRTFVNISGPN